MPSADPPPSPPPGPPARSPRPADDDAAQRRRRRVNRVSGATPLGLLLARLGRAEVVPGPHGLWLACRFRPVVPVRAAAVTVGDVVLLRMSAEQARARPRLLAHEARHAAQWARWLGPVGFLPAYAAASAWSWLRHGDAAVGNGFEVRAGLLDGGYGARARRRGVTTPAAREPG